MQRRPTAGVQHRIPTTANVAIVVAQLAAVAALLTAAARAHGGWATAAVAVAFAVVMNSVYGTVHEAEHGMLLPNRRANDAVGAGLALLFPGPFHLLRQGHLGHHLRNRSDDEAFDLYFDGDNLVWRWMCWVGILTGGFYLLVYVSNGVAAVCPFVFDRRHYKVMDRASAAFAESFNASHRWLIWIEGTAAVALHVAILRVVPAWHYAAVYGAFGFTWSAMQYVHHFGTERHVTRGARNLFLFAPIDAVWLNHNWHRNHHEHPTVPWVYLPKLGREDEPRRGFLPLYYLRMWRGPRRTAERVANKYAGRIIQ